MTKLIKLTTFCIVPTSFKVTEEQELPILVNPEHIVSIKKGTGTKTEVNLVNTKYSVYESPEEILLRIEKIQ